MSIKKLGSIKLTEDILVGSTNLASEVTGILGVANGGTGQSVFTNGQLLIGNTTGNTLTKATLTAGSGISITNGAGSISIANTAQTQWVTDGLNIYYNTGNVGIGIINPQAPLAFANILGNKIDLYHSTSGSGDRYGFAIQSGELRIFSGASAGPTGGIAFGNSNTATFAEFMRLTTAGKLGIGTSTPTLGLQVLGGQHWGSNSGMYISPTNDNTLNAQYGVDADSVDLWLNYRGYNDGFTRFRDVRIGNGKGTAIAFFQGSTARLGLGTTSPNAQLHILNSGVAYQQIEAGATYAYLELKTPASGSGYLIKNLDTGNSALDKSLYLWNGNGPIQFVPSGTIANAVTISTAGNLGIGTATPFNIFHATRTQNSGTIGRIQNDSQGTSSYAEFQIGNASDGRELRLGASYNFSADEWKNAWVYAVGRDLALKSDTGAVHVYTGGTTNAFIRTTVTSTGNVGIGTTSPSWRLHVSTTNAVAAALQTTGTYASLRWTGDGGTTNGALTAFNGNVVLGPLNAGGTGVDNGIYINSSANVGIGTTSPASLLHLNGTDPILRLQDSVGGDVFGVYVSDTLGLGVFNFTDSRQDFTISGAGNIGIGTTNPAMRLQVDGGTIFTNSGTTAYAPYFSSINENTLNGMYGLDNDTGDIWINYRGYLNGFTRFRDFRVGNGKGAAIAFFDGSSGYVGIGTENPQQRLHVTGGQILDTSLYIGTTSSYNGSTFEIRKSGIWDGPCITLYQTGTGGQAWSMFSTNTSFSQGAGKLLFYNGTGAGDVAVFDSSGRMGIGEMSPGQKLQVNGTILANPGTSGTEYRDIMVGGINGWSSSEAHGIEAVYGAASSPLTFARFDMHYNGTTNAGSFRWGKLYKGAQGSGYVMTLTATTTTTADLSVSGTLTGTDFILSSDRRRKTELVRISDALAKVLAWAGYTYRPIDGERRRAGLMAQDVEVNAPEVVYTDDDGWKSMSYEQTIPYMVEAIRDLHRMIEALA